MVPSHLSLVYTDFHVPDPGIRFFVRLSGFSKSTYLESTCHGEFLDAKIFPEKLVLQYFPLYIIYIHTKQSENKIFMSLTFPRTPESGFSVKNPVF